MKPAQKRLLLGLPLLFFGIGLLAAARTEALPDCWIQGPGTLPMYLVIWAASGAVIGLGLTSLFGGLNGDNWYGVAVIAGIAGVIVAAFIFIYALSSGHRFGFRWTV
jgi:hypothetical protein